MRWCAVAVVCASCGSGDPTLTILRAGNSAEGEVTSAAGIQCGIECSISVPSGVIVPLDAVVPRGVVFMGWDGGGCTGTDVACAVTVTDDVTVTATFDEKRELVDLPTTGNRDLDILLVNDNSGGTIEEQQNLAATFPALIDTLDDVEGGLPSLHIGVVTSDMGTLGVPTGDPACSDPDGGNMVTGNPDLANQCPQVSGNYLTDTNYTGTLASAFSCISAVGKDGCGFEQHLESMRAALDNNPANNGFLRPTANLAVIILADEDDCSAKHTDLFAPETPELGPLDSFRCFEKGIRCAEGTGPVLRDEGLKTDCVPDETSAYLHDLQTRYVDFLRGLKPSGRNVAVATIVGDAAPVDVARRTPTGSSTARPDLKPSCSYTDIMNRTVTADPGIRLRSFAGAFAHSVQHSVCDSDYSDALAEIGIVLRHMVGYPCLAGALYADDACDLALVLAPGTPAETSQPLAACTAALDNPPCWHAVTGDALCGAQPRIVVEYATPPPADSAVIGSCRID